MRIAASIVGTAEGPLIQHIDSRWLMAYAAALGEHAPEYFDTTRRQGILAHPLFSVCYEWPLALHLRAKTLGDEVAVRGVHATHELTLHRRPRTGDQLATTATITLVERRSPGAYVVIRHETVDAAGCPVTTTHYGSLYLGVDCDGDPRPGPLAGRERERGSPSPPSGEGEVAGEAAGWSVEVPIASTLAHVYTECARIWNPIHTDRAVALGAGLPDIILHGTATLALAVSEALRRQPRGPATAVKGIACRFASMVRLPSTLTVRGWSAARVSEDRTLRFDALTADGRPALRGGRLVVAE